MTDEKVQELTDKYLDAPFMRISEIVREAYLAGEKAGLEEAAKVLQELTDELAVDKNAAGNTEIGWALQKGVWAMFTARLRILGLAYVPPAAISDCATSDVEAARNTGNTSKQKEKA